METRLRERRINSKNEDKAALQEIWTKVPLELIQNLVHSMNTRLYTVIEAKDAHTKY